MPVITLQELKDTAAVVQSVVTVLAILVGAWWVYFRYWRNAEGRGNIGMECEIEVLDQQNEYCIIEVTAVVHNRGRVPFRIRTLDLNVQGRSSMDPIEYTTESGRNHLVFPSELYSGSFIGKNWVSKVDPGVTTKYRQVLAVPETARIIAATAHLKSRSIGLSQFVAERTKVLCPANNSDRGSRE